MGYWEKIRDALVKGADIIAEKTKEGMNYASLKASLYKKHKELHNLMADLGDLVYDLIKENKDVKASEKVKDFIEKADKLEEACKLIEEQIKKLGEEDKKS